MPKPIQRLWTPHGPQPVYNVERVEIAPQNMMAFAQFADLCAELKLGIHCAACGADLTAKNSTTGQTLAMACGCREFVSLNPHPHAQRRVM